jgi:polysaccharide export outer membrane protein
MKYLAILFALWLLPGPASAAPRGAAASAAASAAIRVGDTLDVQVTGEPTLSKNYVVDASGQIRLEMIGPVAAAGRAPEQLAEELKTRLGRYLKNPSVTVTTSTPLHQEVLVTGEAMRSGPVRLRPGDGLLDLLAAVGGLTPHADISRVALVRRGQLQPQPLHLEPLLKGDLSYNISLQDGDLLQIPRKDAAAYQIIGEVRQPGSRMLYGPVTVLDAIMAAGGITDRADRDRVTLTRKDAAEPITVNLDQVLAGDGSANVTLQPGDVLSVGSRMVVQVAGEVRAAGTRMLRNGGTLMEAITVAGGFAPDADRTAIQVIHRNGETETFNVAEVTTVIGGPVLQQDDLVIVGRGKPQVVTITGAVRNAGQIRYQPEMKITDALMAAGGLLENAKWKEIRVLRTEGGLGRKVMVFNLESYMKAPQAENLPLQPDDQVFVEARAKGGGKSILRRLMEVMPVAGIFFR